MSSKDHAAKLESVALFPSARISTEDGGNPSASQDRETSLCRGLWSGDVRLQSPSMRTESEDSSTITTKQNARKEENIVGIRRSP